MKNAHQVLMRIKDQLDWRSPQGKGTSHIILKRIDAQRLLEGVTLSQLELGRMERERKHER